MFRTTDLLLNLVVSTLRVFGYDWLIRNSGNTSGFKLWPEGNSHTWSIAFAIDWYNLVFETCMLEPNKSKWYPEKHCVVHPLYDILYRLYHLFKNIVLTFMTSIIFKELSQVQLINLYSLWCLSSWLNKKSTLLTIITYP